MTPDDPGGVAEGGVTATPEALDAFIARWSASGAGERSNFQTFANELCALLGVPAPDPKSSDEDHNVYVFEKSVPMDNGDGTSSTKFADLYKAGAFVCEAKQGRCAWYAAR